MGTVTTTVYDAKQLFLKHAGPEEPEVVYRFGNDINKVDSGPTKGVYAAGNLIALSRNFADSSWEKTNSATAVANQIGYDGRANMASTVSDPGAAFSSIRYTVDIAQEDADFILSAFFKKDTDTSRFPLLRLWFRGNTDRIYDCFVNTATGAVAGTNLAVDSDCDSDDWGTYWRVSVTANNDVAANNQILAEVYPSIGTVWKAYSAAATGSAIVDQVDLVRGRTSMSAPDIRA